MWAYDILRRLSTNITHLTTRISTGEIMFLEDWNHSCMQHFGVIRCWLRGNETRRHVSTKVKIFVTCVGETPELKFYGLGRHCEIY